MRALLLGFLTSLSLALGVANAQSFTISTMAGTPGTLSTNVDGTGTAAQFNAPRGTAVDSAGNVYVADATNHTIRKITSAGVVTTLAGAAGTQGYLDGTGTAAKFAEPMSVAVDTSGNVYVADTLNNAIRKITPAGVVTTLAGGTGQGSTNGTGSAAKFNEPRGVAVDTSGTVYVADYQNHLVRKITAAGVVTTLAGTAGTGGSTDATGTAALFKSPNGVAVDSAGIVYIADTGNHTIRKITTAGVVTTFAGSSTNSSILDGTGRAARFTDPRNLSIDSAGTLYLAEYNSHVIRKITSAGVVTTIAGSTGVAGSTDATGTAARFYFPSGAAVDSSGTLFIPDTANQSIRKMTAAGVVTLFAGMAGRTSSIDGNGSAARFEDPYALTADSAGNVYVADLTDHSIRKITPAGVVTTIAGTAGTPGSTDATGTAASFRSPSGIAVDSNGNVYVADTGNSAVRKITPSGVVTTLAGGTGSSTPVNPSGITVDSSGTVYITEISTIRKITSAGVVTTLAGSTNGFMDGTGTAAKFGVLFDLTVDSSGNLYICDHGNHAVRKVTQAGVVTTLAGSGAPGRADGKGTAATFKYPSGIAVDSAGTVYLADTDNQVIRMITAAGVVTTIAGSGTVGSTNGVGTAASFFNPKDVAVDISGNLYVADRGNHTLRKGSATAVAAVGALTGLWWNANESGWGMSVTQHAQTVFVAWYTYDLSGNPSWYVMSSCPLASNTCSGDIYNVVGGKSLVVPWNGSAKVVTKVGVGTLSFSDNNTGVFTYSVNGASGVKSIARQVFASGTTAPAVDYSDLWWNADESGWGVAVTRQYAIIFATIFTYDALGNPVWHVASNCAVSGSGCSGDLYQVTGGSAPTVSWNGENRVVTKIGSVTFSFVDANIGTMTYTINGVSSSKAITRQSF